MFSSHTDLNVLTKVDSYNKNTVSKTVGWNVIESNLPHAWLISEGESVTIAYICTGGTDHFDINPCKILEWKSSNSLSYISPVNSLEPVIVNQNFDGIDHTGIAAMDCAIICAQNPISGMVGIAPRCKIKPIVVGKSGSTATPDDFTAALTECIANPPDLIFTNLECEDYHSGIDAQIKRLKDMGIPFVCNASSFNETKSSYPSFSDHTISACTYNEEGELINYTPNNLEFPAEVSASLNNKYVSYKSSTIATSIITSVITLLISKNKKLIKIAGVSEYSNVDEMLEQLNSFSSPLNSFGAEGSHSYGILDVNKFLSNQTAKQQQEEGVSAPEENENVKKETEQEFSPEIENKYEKPSLIKKIFSKWFK